MLTASLVVTPVIAADTKSRYNSSSDYGTWQNPESDSRKMANELRRLVDKAEKARAADPKFLGDLRKLAAQYDKPLLKTLFVDDFRDRNFTHNPAWTVASGEFWVDANAGLRSRVEQYQASNDQQQQGDVGEALLGALLSELNKDKDKDKDKRNKDYEQHRYQPAVIRQHQRIPNAFMMQADVVSWQRQGRLDLVVYRDSRALNGYRLTYTPGAANAFQLLRVTSRGEAVIDSWRKPANLEDNKIHKLEWRRDKNGKMSVSLDGAALFSVTDTLFRDGFNGFAFVNNAGDYALRRIEVSEIY